jgi:hypothetical protein
MDRQSKPWFRPKRIGWGWTPQTWQGWGITTEAVVGIIGLSRLAH